MTDHEFQKYRMIPVRIKGYLSDTDTSAHEHATLITYGIKVSNENCQFGKPEDEYTYTTKFEYNKEAGTPEEPQDVELHLQKEDVVNKRGYLQPYVIINGLEYPFKGCCLTMNYEDVSANDFQPSIYVETSNGSVSSFVGDGTPCQPFAPGVVKPVKVKFSFTKSAKHHNTEKYWEVLQNMNMATLYFKVTDLSGNTVYKEFTKELSLENDFTDDAYGFIHSNINEFLFNAEPTPEFTTNKFLFTWNVKHGRELIAGSDTPVERSYRFAPPYFTMSLYHRQNTDQVLYQLESTPEGIPFIRAERVEVRVEISIALSGESWTTFETKQIQPSLKNPILYSRTGNLPRNVRRVRIRFKIDDNCYLYSDEKILER